MIFSSFYFFLERPKHSFTHDRCNSSYALLRGSFASHWLRIQTILFDLRDKIETILNCHHQFVSLFLFIFLSFLFDPRSDHMEAASSRCSRFIGDTYTRRWRFSPDRTGSASRISVACSQSSDTAPVRLRTPDPSTGELLLLRSYLLRSHKGASIGETNHRRTLIGTVSSPPSFLQS